MSDLTLVLLAAGMGSRYGGLKQLEAFGPGGETLMDYSIHDAARAGFTRLVFVVRRDFEADFSARIAAKYKGRMDVELAFQALDDLPAGRSAPAERVKPWGTGHALRAARHAVRGPFGVVNADDFYGRAGLAGLADWLRSSAEGQAALVTYPLGATLSAHGTVSRGICAVKDGRLVTVTERTKVARRADHAWAEDAPEGQQRLALDTPVSLNLFGFHPGFMDELDRGFTAFLAGLADTNKGEYQLPGQVNRGVQEGWLDVHALACGEQWFGITYPQDKDAVKAQLLKLVEQGEYPSKLFS
ncbi:MAG TPA: NTP transferase domain-containing protein [bacterium]|nr:NTP transferase domain-containing protein [bacterium]